MPGLKELPDSGLVFDKPGGRIVEAFAQGDVTAQAVIAFYDGALPQLGWRREAPGASLREGERLQLNLSLEQPGTPGQYTPYPQEGTKTQDGAEGRRTERERGGGE